MEYLEYTQFWKKIRKKSTRRLSEELGASKDTIHRPIKTLGASKETIHRQIKKLGACRVYTRGTISGGSLLEFASELA